MEQPYSHSKNYSTVHDVGEFAGTSGDFYENSVEKGLGCATPQGSRSPSSACHTRSEGRKRTSAKDVLDDVALTGAGIVGISRSCAA